MTADAPGAMDTSPVDLPAARAIEGAEAQAWADLYAAAPADWAADVGLRARRVGSALVLEWAATGRRYFSRTIGLGVLEPATEETVDEILRGYAEAGVAMFLLQSQPHCVPPGYDSRLVERGLKPFDAQDRIVRGDEALEPQPPGERSIVPERVARETADEWAGFLQRVYRLDTGPWLQRLIGRPGWSQWVAREGGEIVAARGMFVGAGAAWLGMDGPVPGVTTEDYEPDSVLCKALVREGLAHGARLFVADIEAPSDDQNTPAYRSFGRLGFATPYRRTHYTLRT